MPSSVRRRKRRRVGGHWNSSPSPPESRDWAALPSDVLWDVFRRLRIADILCGAGQVCVAWRRFSIDERSLWRCIDLAGWNKRRRTAMGRVALERSAGQCEAFSGHDAGQFLCRIAASAPSLRSLHVRPFRRFSIHRPSAHLISRVIVKLPLLEELVLSRLILPNPDALLVALLDYCSRLQVLDLGRCVTFSPTATEVRKRCRRRTIKHLTLPRCVPHVDPVYITGGFEFSKL
ncbi:hypothetical protein SETIT_6G103000v2 [Setaria italica]|uniref:F-box domain-containing protein n=1 Tax=Setaria italica TaxID=4555 RepID=A0A368RK51_SETIT|nr:putative F-box/LRR-repeat protein 22 [Setaria italica]RCV30532.1 hypothetical protein SETIT_6G103000v2 [Setaria italica]